MNLDRSASNLIAQLPNGHEILAALGLETRRSISTEVVQAVSLVGLGMVIGAGLALVLAPKSGRELRDAVGERVTHALATHANEEVPGRNPAHGHDLDSGERTGSHAAGLGPA
jgi:hypothetical protein